VDEWKTSLDDTAYCLTCHSKAIRTTLGNGLSFPVTMDEAQLRESVHMDHECSDCHLDFSKDDHLVRDFPGKREHSLALSGVCRQCHDEMYEQYEGSIHYSMLKRGTLGAPVCTDCHGSHFVNPVATLETIAGVPCRRCHQEIFDLYSESMHGLARGATGHIDAPICADCHQAHGVRAAAWTERFKAACLSCHDGVEEAHSVWLPNAGLHLDAVACPSCHAPEAERRIELALFDRAEGRPVTDDDLRAHFGKGSAEGGADQGDRVLSAGDLWQYIRESNRAGKGSPIVLAGQLEVRTGLEAHQMTRKGDSVSACGSCHLKGAEAFQTVTMSLVESDGHVRHVLIDDEVLGSVTSVGSLGGFYALGSTRIRILDILLILAVLGGMSVPALHMTARLLARQRRGREE
jgi:predicted CXXCH cytochrome family protein